MPLRKTHQNSVHKNIPRKETVSNLRKGYNNGSKS